MICGDVWQDSLIQIETGRCCGLCCVCVGLSAFLFNLGANMLSPGSESIRWRKLLQHFWLSIRRRPLILACISFAFLIQIFLLWSWLTSTLPQSPDSNIIVPKVSLLQPVDTQSSKLDFAMPVEFAFWKTNAHVTREFVVEKLMYWKRNSPVKSTVCHA